MNPRRALVLALSATTACGKGKSTPSPSPSAEAGVVTVADAAVRTVDAAPVESEKEAWPLKLENGILQLGTAHPIQLAFP